MNKKPEQKPLSEIEQLFERFKRDPLYIRNDQPSTIKTYHFAFSTGSNTSTRFRQRILLMISSSRCVKLEPHLSAATSSSRRPTLESDVGQFL
jgi:hypothetical protein